MRSAFRRWPMPGPETGVREQASYVLYQGNIRLVVSTPLDARRSDGRALARHGDGVLDIAFLVDDVDACFAEAVRRGATGRTRAVRPQRSVRPHPPGEDSCLRRYAAFVHLDGRLQRAVSARLSGPPPTDSRCGPGADRSHRRQRRRRPHERLGNLLQQRARLPPVHVVRRQGHLDRILGPAQPGDGRTQRRRSSFRSTSRPPASARARSRSISTTTAGPACSTSR